jgi:hypothetical protein
MRDRDSAAALRSRKEQHQKQDKQDRRRRHGRADKRLCGLALTQHAVQGKRAASIAKSFIAREFARAVYAALRRSASERCHG